jgi:branched-chain amino acid transport system substrate-binding protein
MKKYAPGANVNDAFYVYGMAVAWTAVDALKKAGKDLSRASLLKVLDQFNSSGNPFLLPGIALKTSGKDHYPIEQVLLQSWQKGSWRSFGGLWGYRAAS